MTGKDGDPLVLKDSWQEGIAEDARANEYIGLDHLGFILAKDERYNSNLPYLWDYYELYRRGPTEPDISTPKARVGIWLAILRRWAFGTVAGSAAGLKAIRRIEIHSYNEDTGRLEEFTSDPVYVALEAIREYFSEVVKIPLPGLLFPLEAEITPTIAQERSTTEYAFIKRGPVWTIIFEGRQIDGLKGSGFLYLHYLVRNENKDFTVMDLSTLDCLEFQNIGNQDGYTPVEDDPLEEDEDRVKAVVEAEGAFDDGIGLDKTMLAPLRKEMTRLREELQEAKIQSNLESVAELEGKIEGLRKYIIEQYFATKHCLKPGIKKISIRIGRRIKRAIDKISEYDSYAGTHFRKAIHPFAYWIVYRPENHVTWVLQ